MNNGDDDAVQSVLPLDDTVMAAINPLNIAEVDWDRVQRTAYLVRQHLRYEYPGPIHDLHQRLVIIPPELFGDQRRIVYRLEVSVPTAETTTHTDDMGNVVMTVHVPHVEKEIDFVAWIVVERMAGSGPHYLPAEWLSAPWWRSLSGLTAPGDLLRAAAARLLDSGAEGLELAEQICTWVYQNMHYGYEITSVQTTAEEALAGGQGVCQDYAHVMLALCRLCGLPARYVSGHLLGEGGTHAWVDVLAPAADGMDAAITWPFDPTHDRRVGLRYLSIAAGRDYADVAPTSGSFRASYHGQLTARKRVDLTAVEYEPSGI